jgi:hypothetical protein
MNTSINSKLTRSVLGVTMSAIGMAAGCATTRDANDVAAGTPASTVIPEHPGQLAGEDVRLRLDGDVLAGQIKGGTYQVKMVPGGARGTGPVGAIDVRIEKAGQGYHVDGIWNDSRISFVVSKDAIVGTALRQVSGEDPGLESCWYDVEKLWHRSAYAGYEQCPGTANPMRLDVQPATTLGLGDETTAVLIIAFLVAPPVGA